MTCQDIKNRLEKITKYLNLNPEQIEKLLQHKQIKQAELQINNKTYPAWRIIHNNSLGPGKGGIRFHPEVSEDEVKSLSFWMSLKTSLMELPLGGAKGGVKVNPRELSQNEIEELSRKYIRAFHEYLGQDKDIPAPDVYTNPQIMAWMLDEFEKIKQHPEPAMITGKPLELGGLKLREDSTSAGGFIILKKLLEKTQNKKNITIVIQGFGNAGMNIAKMLFNENFKIIAVSDSKGGILNQEGLKINELITLKKQNQSVQNYQTEKISNKELLEMETDVLILAALENQITLDNAENIKAKYILELANGPITSEADKILKQKNIKIIPDILANAGGVVVSYFEHRENKNNTIPNEETLKQEFQKIMEDSFNKVWEHNQKHQELTLRESAYILAIQRILEAESNQ